MGELKHEAKRVARSKSAQRLARAGLVAKGISFGLVAALALAVAFGHHGKLRDRPGALQEVAANGWGRFLLGALAVGLGGYALWRDAQVVAALERPAEEGLREPHLARAVVFALAGIFLIRAAWQYDPKEAIGLDGALRKLVNADWGAVLLGATAAGLMAYGLFALVQARYREV